MLSTDLFSRQWQSQQSHSITKSRFSNCLSLSINRTCHLRSRGYFLRNARSLTSPHLGARPLPLHLSISKHAFFIRNYFSIDMFVIVSSSQNVVNLSRDKPILICIQMAGPILKQGFADNNIIYHCKIKNSRSLRIMLTKGTPWYPMLPMWPLKSPPRNKVADSAVWKNYTV